MAVPRIRNLTPKAQEAFEFNLIKRKEQVRAAWTNFNTEAAEIPFCKDSRSSENLSDNLEQLFKQYNNIHQDLIDFLTRTNTVKCNELVVEEQTLRDLHIKYFETCKRTLTDSNDETLTKMQSTTSEKSVKSKSSQRTSASSVIARTRTKAEGAKVRLQFAEAEAELKRQHAAKEEQRLMEMARSKKEETDLEIELGLLSQKREAAAMEAEIEALENSEGDGSRMEELDSQLPDGGIINAESRTEDYVKSVQFQFNNKKSTVSRLNPGAENFVPQAPITEQPAQPTTLQTNIVSDLSSFLLKKELLMSRLSNFNDRPEAYRPWKLSFQLIMSELNANPQEELDLLQKWSGPDSQKHVLNIKAANISSPVDGVRKVWERLDERYGSPEMLEASLKRRVESFPKLTPKDDKKLYEFSDLVAEIESVKDDQKLKVLLAHYDSSVGVNPLVNKLPYYLQQKWTTTASRYMNDKGVPFLPFAVFASFMREQSKIRNNPSFAYDSITPQKERPNRKFLDRNIAVKKTETKYLGKDHRRTESEDTLVAKCPLHHTDHTLNMCRTFKSKPLPERFRFLRERKICFKCCESSSHTKRDCPKASKCVDCHSDTHPSALHVFQSNISGPGARPPAAQHGGESTTPPEGLNTACTQICGRKFPGKSCAKIVLSSVYLASEPLKRIHLYAILDDQSNRTIANAQFFDAFGVEGNLSEYVLSSCSGKTKTSGRQVDGLVLESNDKSVKIELPTVTECSHIPDNRTEIPTPEVAQCYHHLQDIACQIPEVDEKAQIMLLIGRDVTKAHHVIDQRIGPGNTPYAQKLPLGWTIIGESCLGKTHQPDQFDIRKTTILENGRPTLFQPCTNTLKLQDVSSSDVKKEDSFGKDVFIKTKDDETPGLSIDDRSFLEMMDVQFRKDDDGSWTCPLPFRQQRPRLQNNFSEVIRRATALDRSLSRDGRKKDHFREFMQKLLEKGHAEKAPPMTEGEECWYLPIFGVYHPKKQDQVRVVFDSAAKYHNVALNDVLLSGPDLTNSLLGVLLRFRREAVAVIADIQQMFYCFKVNKEHRNFLRFLWHDNNDFDQPLVEYRMCVHVFGNTASPAVATYGLRKAASLSSAGPEITEFVHRDFYVDDGLTSRPTPEEAVDLIRKTQDALKAEGNLRLHKIASNREEVMAAFSTDDLAKDIKDLDLGSETLPTQRSLGVAWDLESDSFLFRVSMDPQPYTRRGLLSTVNSIFDPMGFLAPVVIEGKMLLRQLIHGTIDWDEPLPDQYHAHWDRWRNSLQDLHDVKIPRTYFTTSFNNSKQKSVHIFSDASELAIAAVGYIQSSDREDKSLGFVLGKAKVAPTTGHTIPRLELCAAVLAVEVAESISRHLNLPIEEFRFYSDSRVVLGYINNQSRRFYTYVSNRVQRIRSVSNPDQWSYVPTEKNPADQGTRSIPASEMRDSMWLNGPSYKLKETSPSSESFPMQEPDGDKEVRPEVVTLKTDTDPIPASLLGSHRFARFSSWKKLVEAIACLRQVATRYKTNTDKVCTEWKSVEAFNHAEKLLMKEVQMESYSEERECLQAGRQVPKNSSISELNPFIDKSGLVRVGGRLKNAKLSEQERNPVLLPGSSHIALLIVRHYHERTEHQGRHITAGAVRSAGFWITGSKRLVSSVLHKCVKCRKLRGSSGFQKMADLPEDRLEPGPPFTNVGVDCFGPWEIVTRRTRGGQANSKRWAALFTCLTTRAIHIEVLEELSSSSFINALRRFIAIRGPVKVIRSDQGTNFIGSAAELGIETHTVQEGKVRDFLYKNNCTWIFNPPHASHMGGIWERMIGVTRRILDALLMEVRGNGLTHEVLTTFLAEASAIVNSRPLVPVSTDPEDPLPLSPSLILTQKPCLVPTTFDLGTKDMYRSQWKKVQVLADAFWSKWRAQYLQTLQGRRKWTGEQRNFSQGDVVLLKDKQATRISWPMGVVINAYTGDDDLVRTVEVRVVQDGGRITSFVRPVTEVVLLLENETV